MKFIFIGVEWNFTSVVAVLWIMLGCHIIFWPFMISDMGWWNLLVVVVVVIYLATAEAVIKKLGQ